MQTSKASGGIRVALGHAVADLAHVVVAAYAEQAAPIVEQ
jgi:hypothetical protein